MCTRYVKCCGCGPIWEGGALRSPSCGVDGKTVRRYVEVAVACGLDRAGGQDQLTNGLIGQVCERVRPPTAPTATARRGRRSRPTTTSCVHGWSSSSPIGHHGAPFRHCVADIDHRRLASRLPCVTADTAAAAVPIGDPRSAFHPQEPRH